MKAREAVERATTADERARALAKWERELHEYSNSLSEQGCGSQHLPSPARQPEAQVMSYTQPSCIWTRQPVRQCHALTARRE